MSLSHHPTPPHPPQRSLSPSKFLARGSPLCAVHFTRPVSLPSGAREQIGFRFLRARSSCTPAAHYVRFFFLFTVQYKHSDVALHETNNAHVMHASCTCFECQRYLSTAFPFAGRPVRSHNVVVDVYVVGPP